MTRHPSRALRHVVAFTLALATASSVAVAQQQQQEPPPVRLRGQIESVEGQRLTINERGGETVQVQLADEPRILAVSPAELESVGPGTFIGTAAVPQPDGTLRALELVVFPEEMRGTGEGHYPWDLTPESTMTNATVEAMVSEAKGEALTLTYPGGEQTIVVPPETPIVTLAPGDAGLLQPGAHVFVPGATEQPDGTFAAQVIAVGRDGLVPPM